MRAPAAVPMKALAAVFAAFAMALSPAVASGADRTPRPPASRAVTAPGPRRPSSAAPAQAVGRPSSAATAPAARRAPSAATAPGRAPSAPPLATGSGFGISQIAAEEASASSPSSEGEPLEANGLSSPLCRDAGAAAGGLPASAARNCRATGFEGTQAPSGDYAFDVHINTGVAHIDNTMEASFQDIMQFWWTSLVSIVHGLIVLLDWCFTLDLLNSPAMSGLTRGLRATQATFTRPWLVSVLAIAAVIAAYRGLIRRRVAETVGEALLMLAMMAGGLWVIANPTGTIGALGAWANEASLGALGAVMAGTPDHPQQTLAESNQGVFGAAIEVPWCYLEFGDVSWCRNPARLDAELRAAALKIAAKGGGDAPGTSMALVRGARTNGELFLALPANGPARNSINEAGSLFHLLCGGSAEPCVGPTAGEADFRTQSGTLPRAFGLLFISFGLLGMLLVLGAIVLRLLAAAFVSLIYLLLTPAAVLAPALGERGREVFRAWGTRLVGAVTSKLVFSFLLGTVLAIEQVIAGLRIFGWLTQWLLISALWWLSFYHRHKLLDFVHGERGGERRSIVRRAHEALGTTRRAVENVRWAKRELARPAPSAKPPREPAPAGGKRVREPVDAQARRSLEREQVEARERVEAAPRAQARLAGMRAQLARVRDARARAAETGDGRGAARLAWRERRVASEIAREEGVLRRARQTLADGESAQRRGGQPHTRERREERARFLDAQAALPRAGRLAAGGERRDYAALAGLAGYGPDTYERLRPREQREARLRIDRELETRREWEMRRELTGTAAGHRRDGGQRVEVGKGAEAETVDPRARRGARRSDGPPSTGSLVLDDAREVAARRKRQLGKDRP